MLVKNVFHGRVLKATLKRKWQEVAPKELKKNTMSLLPLKIKVIRYVDENSIELVTVYDREHIDWFLHGWNKRDYRAW